MAEQKALGQTYLILNVQQPTQILTKFKLMSKPYILILSYQFQFQFSPLPLFSSTPSVFNE